MSRVLKPCLDCGELTSWSRCEDCGGAGSNDRRGRGYDHRWEQLSKKARQLQPFCDDCGSTEDLTTDHTPEAWERKERGLLIRLRDVAVVCRSCNGKRGKARPAPGEGSAAEALGTARLFFGTHSGGAR